ncbi:MAG: thymidylate kinase [Candidatus Binatia bacterium]|nr:MAG: thymidylate kinase [Candidatus Binatia bacterium]
MPVSRRGRLIVFEGGEGAGKSTHLRRAAATLRQRGWPVLETAEPGGTAIGQQIRRILMDTHAPAPATWTELFLYLADRAEHVATLIGPALLRGDIVLCDRFSASTLAYQGFGRGLDLDLLRQLDGVARQGVEADLVILLDCPVELGLRRAGRDDRFHRESLAFHEKVRAGFLALAQEHTSKFIIVDTNAPLDEVATRILAAIDQCLERH